MDIIRQIKQNRMISGTFSNSEQARTNAVRNAMIQIAVATIAFALMMRVFPMGAVQNHLVSEQKAYNASEKAELTGDIFTGNDKKLQTVFFGGAHIYQITLYMKCAAAQDSSDYESVLFRLYNDEFSCVYQTEADCKKIEREGRLIAVPDMDVAIGTPYYYEILVGEESRSVCMLPVADRGALAQPENSSLYIDGIINDEVSLIADFIYTSPLSMAGIIAHYFLIAAGALITYLLVLVLVQVYDEHWSQNSGQIGKYVRLGIALLSILLASALFVYAVILNKFGGELWDRLFFSIGIVVLEMWLIGALWRMTRVIRPKKRSQMSAVSKMCLVWRDYIQTVSIGMLFWSLCQYVNADRNLYHFTNTRWMLIFLAIAFLMNYSEKLFVNRLSVVWLVLGAAGSALYCKSAGTDENGLLLARLTCGVVVAWGLLILNILLNEVQVKAANIQSIVREFSQRKQQIVYAGLWIFFCILMYVYRFEKTWVFTATLPFIVYIFSKSTLASKSRFLRNFTNGILLSFAMVTVFCLHHRPHHYWMLYRYGGLFHTVACTGMYLAVVFGAALARLYGKLKVRTNMVKFCYGEYFVTVCVAGFILLTMSRTAFLTVIVTVLAVVILTAVTYHKGVKRILSELGILVMLSLMSFPMVYTTVRMVPAVINDPVRYGLEYEDRSFMIYEGDPIDSDKYMTVRRFFSTLFGRFQTQTDTQEAADNGVTLREIGMIAYMGDNFAGLDVRAANDQDSGDAESYREKDDISNGRFDIFKDYLKAIELKGHPKMGPVNEKGEEYSHAHNSYLQVAYNFGMIAGVIFLILCALTLWRAIRLFMEYGSRYNIFLVPVAMTIVFGFASLTEWAFHPCIPVGFSFILMQVFLMRDCN